MCKAPSVPWSAHAVPLVCASRTRRYFAVFAKFWSQFQSLGRELNFVFVFSTSFHCVASRSFYSCNTNQRLSATHLSLLESLFSRAQVLKALAYVYTVGPRFLLVLNTQYMTNASEGWGAPDPLNTDGRPLPTKRRWRTSSKACARRSSCYSSHLLHACAHHFRLP